MEPLKLKLYLPKTVFVSADTTAPYYWGDIRGAIANQTDLYSWMTDTDTEQANQNTAISALQNLTVDQQTELDELMEKTAFGAANAGTGFVSTNVDFTVSGDVVVAKQWYINPATGAEFDASKTLPLASATSAGLMSMGDYVEV